MILGGNRKEQKVLVEEREGKWNKRETYPANGTSLSCCLYHCFHERGKRTRGQEVRVNSSLI